VSFDELAGTGEDRGRHGEAEPLCGLQIDNQLEFRRLLHRQIGRFRAGENPADIGPDLAINPSEACSIADQPAGSGEFTPLIDRRNGIARRQRYELVAPAVEEWVVSDKERPGLQ
jgi:hypothetical protein